MPPESSTKPAEPASPPKPAKAFDASDPDTFTAEPVLGRADRIDGDETTGVVAFTFDDGPNPATTPAVLDALQKYNIPATFFIVTQRITGKHGEKSREVLARELEGGFLVGSHSVTHANLKHATGAVLDKEINTSIKALAPEAHRPIGMFRPPFGSFNSLGRMRLKKLGVTEVLWSVDTLDWKAKNADKLRKKVINMIIKQKGGVVLMHDVKPITAKIVADVFDDLEAENCRRLADKRDPIIPVSLHYFLKNGKTPRPIPADVSARTDAYKAALPVRCATRPKPVEPPPAAPKPAP